MDLITYFILIAFVGGFTGIGVAAKSTLFCNLGGIISVSGLGYLMSSGSIVLHTAYSGGFISSNASASDYVVYFIILTVITVIPFLMSLEIRIKNNKQ